MGVHPTGLHVFCGLGESVRPCPSGSPLGGAPGVWSMSKFGPHCKSDAFPVRVGLRQGCPLSPILFIIFMDRISRRSQGVEGVRLGDLRIGSLLFADDVVLLASSGRDLQLSLERFAAECQAAEMRIRTSKSETMVLSQKRVECSP